TKSDSMTKHVPLSRACKRPMRGFEEASALSGAGRRRLVFINPFFATHEGLLHLEGGVGTTGQNVISRSSQPIEAPLLRYWEQHLGFSSTIDGGNGEALPRYWG